jgi:hypothetical protein
MAHPSVSTTRTRTKRLVWVAIRPPRPVSGMAIAVDGPRQWLHVGVMSMINTYGASSGALLFSSPAYPVDGWTRLRTDKRRSDLLMLGKSGSDYVVYQSQDGGMTGTGVLTVAATNALIERDSERGKAVALLQDGSGNITYQRSDDGGTTWGTAAACMLYDAGGMSSSALVATLLDCSQDPRRAAMNLTCTLAAGSHVVLESRDVGATWEQKVAIS